MYADGVYDKEKIFQELASRGLVGKIPSSKDSKIRAENKNPWFRGWNQGMKRIRELGNYQQAHKEWREEEGYHTRSLTETGMFRFKTMFEERFRSTIIENQKVELYVNHLTR